VDFLVTMNGFDYDDDNTDQKYFTFEGTGSPMNLLPVVLFILVVGFLIFSAFSYLFAKQRGDQYGPGVIQDHRNNY
jgi:hypothetical protein